MEIEFTVQGRTVAEIRAAVRARLDDLGDDIEWRQMRLDIRPAVGAGPDGRISLWLGDFMGTDEPEVAEEWDTGDGSS